MPKNDTRSAAPSTKAAWTISLVVALGWTALALKLGMLESKSSHSGSDAINNFLITSALFGGFGALFGFGGLVFAGLASRAEAEKRGEASARLARIAVRTSLGGVVVQILVFVLFFLAAGSTHAGCACSRVGG